MTLDALQKNIAVAIEAMGRCIYGKEEQIRLTLAALLAGGHVLLEDVPGTGKTTLAKALARLSGCDFGRVQFTPDLLPSELTGLNFFSPKTGEFSFRPGALFTQILLADEINRATPRTQSGLLESMEERQITVDGVTYPLPEPYFVIATQNPVETQGTFPLPEAQLDRFLICLSLGYPTREQTAALLQGQGNEAAMASLRPLWSTGDILSMRTCVAEVYLHPAVADYIVTLAEATRSRPEIALGVSTRGCRALVAMAKALAAIGGRTFVTPDEVKTAMPYVFSHRLLLRGGHHEAAPVLQQIMAQAEVPVEKWER